jgi:hypothetical protein
VASSKVNAAWNCSRYVAVGIAGTVTGHSNSDSGYR